MANDALAQLFERRVQREVSAPVERNTIEEWTAFFGSAWPECAGDVAPSVMYTTFVRPAHAPPPGETPPTGVVLHDELKALLDLPVAIAVGYELEIAGEVRVGDQLVAVERIAEVGEERTTKFGPGRDWIIEVATSTSTGVAIGVEKFRMLGYRPGETGSRPPRLHEELAGFDWNEELDVDADFIVRGASANHVWAGAHHHRDAARAAGLPDIILDTSSQVALLAGAAQRRFPSRRIRSVDLAMKRPLLPGAKVMLAGSDGERSTVVSAVVDEREASRANITFAN